MKSLEVSRKEALDSIVELTKKAAKEGKELSAFKAIRRIAEAQIKRLEESGRKTT